MQQQLIADWLTQNQASISDAGELNLPGYTEQLAAIAAGTAYSCLSKYSILRISGDDAVTFLQGQFSCDVAAIAEHGASWGSYSTAKGRMQASFLLCGNGGVFHLLLRRDIAETFRKRLSMFVLRAKVTIENLNESMLALGVMRSTACNSTLPVIESVHADEIAVAITPQLSIILSAKPALWLQQWQQTLHAVGSEAWELVFIQAGLPWVSQATYEEFVPQMANLDLLGGISFKKGCYPGQEIVARTQYLGKVKRRLYRAAVYGGSVAAGDALQAASTGEQTIGKVVAAVVKADGSHECLLVMQASAWEDGVQLAANPGARLEQLPLPYALTESI